ncbi:flagellinolysin [Dendrosporobacter sp. 1207_IL3150]|uniref:flagellinolysin n=1 Tax=Dendrosporobacter sp. 1207_IL3150 TaxID=3084054 RepID=UPI002FD8E337
MRINTNIAALNSHRMYNMNNSSASKSLEKLSSGLRINKAGDDAAGLSISEKMRGQIRGLGQASRNIQDGISMLQTAEGGLNEVHAILQRGRELSVQAANGTLTTNDRQSIQDEVKQILSEVDRIANTTQFNSINLLNVSQGSSTDMQQVLTALKTVWLQNSEQLIQAQYGLSADGASLEIVLDQAPQAYLAAVSYNLDVDGKAINQQLHIDMSDFLPATLPNGGTAPMYDDRIIAHEMVHAIMGRTMNFGSLPKWFKEGTAEFIHGADERLAGDIALNGGGAAGAMAVENAIGDGTDGTWVNDSLHYSAGYAAVKYLDATLTGGILGLMTYLKTNSTDTLDQALAAEGTYANIAAFIADFNGAGASNGSAFIQTLNLADADTGAIGGGSATTVVDDTTHALTDNPLTNFAELWPTITSGADPLKIQVGANSGGNMNIALTNVTTAAMALTNVDLVNQASDAITQFDSAIGYVSSERSRIGAMQNRLEHTMSVTLNTEENITASESRIRDVNMAKEIMLFSKENILTQAATSMLAQANQQPQGILQLLRAG